MLPPERLPEILAGGLQYVAMNNATGSIHVIHVDDEPGFAKLAAEFRQRNKDRLVCEPETDPREALEKITERDYDCVISDYDIPQLNGIELLKRVRSEYPDLLFILFTGKGSEEVASEAISAGVTDYLQKEGGSAQYAVLANRVSTAVAAYRTHRERERFEQAVEQTGHAVYITDMDGTIGYVNSALERITGYPAEHAVIRRPMILKFGEMDTEYYETL